MSHKKKIISDLFSLEKNQFFYRNLNKTSRLDFSKSKDYSRRNNSRINTTSSKKSSANSPSLSKNSKPDSSHLMQQYKLKACYTNRSLKEKQLELNSTLRKKGKMHYQTPLLNGHLTGTSHNRIKIDADSSVDHF